MLDNVTCLDCVNMFIWVLKSSRAGVCREVIA